MIEIGAVGTSSSISIPSLFCKANPPGGDVLVGVLRVARLLVRDSRERPSQKPNTGTLLALQRVNIAKCMRWEIVEHASLNCFTWGKFDRQVVG